MIIIENSHSALTKSKVMAFSGYRYQNALLREKCDGDHHRLLGFSGDNNNVPSEV